MFAEVLVPSLFYSKTMSDFLDGIALGLSPQDLFSEEMEVESLTTQGKEAVRAGTGEKMEESEEQHSRHNLKR